MTDPAVPSPSALVAPAIDALVAQRPNALQWINGGTGRYSHVIAGWRAQAALHVKRWARELAASRLDLCSGDELRELCASEFETRIDQSPRQAVGSVVLKRTAGTYPLMTIRRGDIFVRNADPTAKPVPIQAAQYEAVHSATWPQGVGGPASASQLIVQLRATRPGTHANIAQNASGVWSTQIQPQVAFTDTNATVVAAFAGGGSSGIDDVLLRKIAKANYSGQFGPNRNALVAGAYLTRGVRFLYVFENVFNVPVTTVFVADESWATSLTFANEVAQTLHDGGRIGFGCRVATSSVSNQFVTVAATVSLKKSQHLWDTREIENAIRAACKAFFDQRPDWYTWRLSSLRAAISRAHPKISSCTSATVSDYTTGSPIAEPPVIGSGDPVYGSAVHYYLPDEAVQVTYAPPT